MNGLGFGLDIPLPWFIGFMIFLRFAPWSELLWSSKELSFCRSPVRNIELQLFVMVLQSGARKEKWARA